MSSVPSVTGAPPLCISFLSSFAYIRGGGTCHTWNTTTNNFNIPLVYWGLGGSVPVTYPVTKVAQDGYEKVYAIIYSMSYEVHPTWIDGEHAIFYGSLAECQQFCFRNLAVFNLLTFDYPFRLKIGEQIEINQEKS